MQTLKTTIRCVVVVSLLSLQSSSAKTCDGLFRCTDSDSFQLCSSASNETYKCEGGTYCSVDCAFPCTATPDCAPRCNDAGFYCTNLYQAQLCEGSDSPSGDVITCPDSHVCNMYCDTECSPTPCTNSNSPPPSNNTVFPCIDVGLFPDPNNARNFFLCSMLSTGALQPALYICPKDHTFNADKTCVYSEPDEAPTCGEFQFHCLNSTDFSVCVDEGFPEGQWTCPQGTFCHEDNEQPCSEFVPTTTTAAPFVCESHGKFPDPVNCSVYYMCARRESGGFHQKEMSCPAASFFNRLTEYCTRDSKVCTLSVTSPPTPVTTPRPPFVCTQAGRFPDPTNCDNYYQCTRRWFTTSYIQSRRRCTLGRRFDSIRHRCVSRNAATCAEL